MNFKDTIQGVDTVCCMLQKHANLLQDSCFPGLLKPYYNFVILTFSFKVLILPTTSICMCMQCDLTHCETARWCVATLSIALCACHVQYTQRGSQRPHTDPHSQLVGEQCLPVHPVLVFPSFPICHIVNTATEKTSGSNILINGYHEYRWCGN
jgi:hypothetical protein